MSKIVRATAGAGKTTGLLEAVYDSYKSFYMEKGIWPKILLSTFTVKAANELSERLIKKAVKDGDQDFLDYASSNFLEVGTLHSVFSKILDKLASEEKQEEKAYFSQSQRYIIGRGFLHKAIKDLDAANVFLSQRDEKEVLEVFLHLYDVASNDIKIASYEDLVLSVEEAIKAELIEIGDVKAVEVFRSIDDIESLKSYISSFPTKEQKPFKAVKKLIEDESNLVPFIQKYYERHVALLSLYSKWRSYFAEYSNTKNIKSISDIEVKILQKLKDQNYNSKSWDFCFFDEYQDTSPIQKNIIDILAARSVKYFVGDPFQSIYFFRGARKEIFTNEFDSIEEKGGDTEYRLNNYRSAPEIVNFVNGVTKYTLPDFMPMEPHVEGVLGHVEVPYFEEGSITDEYEFIKEKLKEINLEKESVAILSRGAKELLDCGKLLKSANVPYKYSLSKGFESSLEIIELISFLKFLENPEDDQNLLVLLMSSWCEVSDLEIKDSFGRVREKEALSLWDVLKDHEGVSTLTNLKEISRNLSYSVVLSEFVGTSGFLDCSADFDQTGSREKNILKLITALSAEELQKGFYLLGFCDDILSGKYRFESEEVKSASGCILMTIHGSKGLQFDHVFILGANKSVISRSKPYFYDLDTNLLSLKETTQNDGKMKFPHFIQGFADAEKEEVLSENLRLLYVAMTRAKQSLFIIGSKKIAKTSVSPSWMSRIISHFDKTGEEAFLNLLDPCEHKETTGGVREKAKGFLSTLDSSEFLEKKSLAVTGSETEADSEYSGDLERFSKLAFGISEGVLFHELMERAQGEVGALEGVDKVFTKDLKKHTEAVEYLFKQKEFPFKKILEDGFKEWGFDFSGETRVSGKVDVWARIDNEVWLVDYKTGSASRKEKGFDQLKSYQKMIKSYLKNDEDLKFNLVLTFPYDKTTYMSLDV